MRAERVFGRLALVALALLVTACIGGVQAQGEDLGARVDRLEQRLGDLEERVTQLREEVRALKGQVASLAPDTWGVGASRAEFLPDPPPGQVTVQLLAEVEGGALPGTFEFHLAPEGAQLFETLSLPAGEEPDLGPLIPDGIAFVEPGKFYRLQVVYRNPEDREVKFLVRGGLVDPLKALPFVRNRCWCAAIPFTAPPRGTFVRVIEVGVGPDTPPGAKAIVVFPVVPLSE